MQTRTIGSPRRLAAALRGPARPGLAIALCAALAACKSSPPPPAAPPPNAETPSPKPPAVKPPETPKGKVSTEHFHSASLGVDKDYVVYLPADYDTKPSERFPVFYYLHGLGGDENSWLKGGHIDQAADQLGLEAIIVMPDGDAGFYVDSVTPVDYDACMKTGKGQFVPTEDHAKACVKTPAYEDYIVKDLIAEIDGKYRTIARRDGRAIAGLSMGGFGALELAMRHPDVFSATASHSGVDALLYAGPHPYVAGKMQPVTDVSTWGDKVPVIGTWVRSLFGPKLDNWKAHDPSLLADKLEPGKLAIYLDCGTEDDYGLDAQAAYLHDQLTARKIDHAYFEGPGKHDFAFWGPRLPESLKFLRDHVAKPTT
ncbi:MAG TPA: alpha/beta hydrolase family protein [Kofleriaceae bacterium]|nr:alpha/beta hydrolase family protein [Kofleriaceae bacterium]